jgi:hypothetical protein
MSKLQKTIIIPQESYGYLCNYKKCTWEFNSYDKDTEYNLATFGCGSCIGFGVVADNMQFLMHISHVGMLKNIKGALCGFFNRLKNRNVINANVYVIGNEFGTNDKTFDNILNIISINFDKSDFNIKLIKKNQSSIILNNDLNNVKEFIMTNTNQNEICEKYPSSPTIILNALKNNAQCVCDYHEISKKTIIIDYSKNHISLNSLGYDESSNSSINDDDKVSKFLNNFEFLENEVSKLLFLNNDSEFFNEKDTIIHLKKRNGLYRFGMPHK